MIHKVKGFGVINKTEVDVFLELSCFFDDPVDVGNLISGSSAFSKSSLNIWKFMVHVLLKPGLENFEHYFASMWDEFNCVVVWTPSGYSISAPWCRRVATAIGQLSGGEMSGFNKIGSQRKASRNHVPGLPVGSLSRQPDQTTIIQISTEFVIFAILKEIWVLRHVPWRTK